MRKVRKIVVLVCGLGVMYAITAASNHSIKSKSVVYASAELNNIIETQQQNECFEAMMSEWFESFSMLQENGLSISEADNKASEAAVNYFTTCD